MGIRHDMFRGGKEASKTVLWGVLLILFAASLLSLTDSPKVVRNVDIIVRSDGSTSYTRTVAVPDKLIFGYGEVREPGASQPWCRGTWTWTYQVTDRQTTDRDIDWMLNIDEGSCSLPLPVGADWKFVYTPANPDYSKTIVIGKVVQ